MPEHAGKVGGKISLLYEAMKIVFRKSLRAGLGVEMWCKLKHTGALSCVVVQKSFSSSEAKAKSLSTASPENDQTQLES